MTSYRDFFLPYLFWNKVNHFSSGKNDEQRNNAPKFHLPGVWRSQFGLLVQNWEAALHNFSLTLEIVLWANTCHSLRIAIFVRLLGNRSRSNFWSTACSKQCMALISLKHLKTLDMILENPFDLHVTIYKWAIAHGCQRKWRCHS